LPRERQNISLSINALLNKKVRIVVSVFPTFCLMILGLLFSISLNSHGADLRTSEDAYECVSDYGSRVCIIVQEIESRLIFTAQNRERYPVSLLILISH